MGLFDNLKNFKITDETVEKWGDDLKEFFKTKEQKEKDAKKYKRFKEEEKKLIDVLGSMDREWNERNPEPTIDYGSFIRPTLVQDRKKLDTRTYDDHRTDAENLYGDEYRKKRNYVDKSYYNNIATRQEEIDKIDNDAKNELLDIKDKYNRLKKKTKYDVLKNGIMKSSIAGLIDDELDAKKNAESDAKNDARDVRVNAKKRIMDRLTEDREKALRDLDVRRVNSINKMIEDLTNKQTQYNNRVKEYNNKANKRESDYEMRRQRAINEFRQADRVARKNAEWFEEMYGYRGKKKANYDQRFKLASDLYSQMPKRIAIESIKNNRDLRLYLGKKYSDLLADQAKR